MDEAPGRHSCAVIDASLTVADAGGDAVFRVNCRTDLVPDWTYRRPFGRTMVRRSYRRPD